MNIIDQAGEIPNKDVSAFVKIPHFSHELGKIV